MWARNVELMLGLWLILSPMIFEAAPVDPFGLSLIAGTAVVIIALACYWRPLRRAHLITLAIGVALGLSAWIGARPLAAMEQNHIAVGLLLAMLAACPSEGSRPPPDWRPAD